MKKRRTSIQPNWKKGKEMHYQAEINWKKRGQKQK